MPEIPPALLPGGGLAGLVLLAIWLVLTGRLVPRSTLDKLVETQGEQIAHLRAAHAAEVERGVVRDRQVDELLEHSRVTEQFLRSMPYAAAAVRRDSS